MAHMLLKMKCTATRLLFSIIRRVHSFFLLLCLQVMMMVLPLLIIVLLPKVVNTNDPEMRKVNKKTDVPFESQRSISHGFRLKVWKWLLLMQHNLCRHYYFPGKLCLQVCLLEYTSVSLVEVLWIIKSVTTFSVRLLFLVQKVSFIILSLCLKLYHTKQTLTSLQCVYTLVSKGYSSDLTKYKK